MHTTDMALTLTRLAENAGSLVSLCALHRTLTLRCVVQQSSHSMLTCQTKVY